jgi:hypothetical protein
LIPESKDQPEIWKALTALLDGGIELTQAMKCLAILTEADFLVTRPQTLIDRVVCSTMEDK